ncbi:S8 family serine peptidase [Bacillus thuringiensis]|uniref:S8 family serine peptidase n=2 Tax=Bacillus TaxID=1386 RepID=UPI0008FE543C|nr:MULTISPECIES: S8 family serine peptidase [Bacillus cereus group]MDA1764034.1 S8 family serine peptidase [Bacillus cereus]MED2879011.1 S8 family serine peptidase [Bacillus thuringiensis]MYW26091.1 S8 family serine peptidase [Bacillus thuringiensis]OJE29612.1 BacP protein [Bacillus thuringiensis]ONG95007.1 BacP protein [Bacillus cereus]
MKRLKILMTILSVFLLSLVTQPVKAEEIEKTDNYKFILLDNEIQKNNKENIINFLEENNAIEIKYTPEIQMISYKETNSNIQSDLDSKIRTKFKASIENVANSAKLTLQDPKILNPNEQFANNKLKYNLSSKRTLNSITINEPVSNVSPPWQIAKVTDNYKSHEITLGEKNVNIALVDSGVDYNHPELKNSIKYLEGKSYVPSEPDLLDQNGHGTQVAGIIAAHDKLKGIVPNITITPYKVIGKKDGESVWTIQAIIDAANNGADVINLSLGTYKAINLDDENAIIKAYERAIQYAKEKNSIVVASAGNEGINLDKPFEKVDDEKGVLYKIHVPGGLSNVLTVSGTDKNDEFVNYSNFGPEVDFSAPSGSYGTIIDNQFKFDPSYLIGTTYPTYLEPTMLDAQLNTPKGYTLNLGTSLSAPSVSGTLGAIISRYYELHSTKPSADITIKYLKDGATDLGATGKDDQYGYGLVNSYKSTSSVK